MKNKNDINIRWENKKIQRENEKIKIYKDEKIKSKIKW